MGTVRLDQIKDGTPICVSFSGGRTSAYMTHWLLANYRDRFPFVVTFANTGLEDARTLDFVHNCDQAFAFNTVWLEGVTHPDERKATTHKIVTYETASRSGEPFEAMIKKYGIPNIVFQPCTRELKKNTMESYRESIGTDPAYYPTAIGIRADETRRVKRPVNMIYPLVFDNPVDKSDVLDFWRAQAFDLGIEEHEGNCKGCFKKSDEKLFRQIESDPSVFDSHREMERLYRSVGSQIGDRVFFRGHRDTNALFATYEAVGRGRTLRQVRPDEDAGCSESCEPWDMT